MLGNIRISFKLLAMVALSLIGMIGIALVGLGALKTNLLEDRKARLRDVVIVAMQDVSREYQNGIAAGLSKDAANARAAAALRGIRYGNDDYFLAYDKSGISTAHPDPKIEGHSRWDVKDPDGVYYVRAMIEGAARGGAFVGYRFPHIGSKEPVQKLTYALEVKENGWIIGSGIYIDDVDTIFRSYVWRIGSIVGVTLLVVLGASVLLGRSITRPALALTRAMRALADGNLETAVPHVAQRDELGNMARAVVVFKEHALVVRRLESEQAEAREQAEAEKRLALTAMADTIERDTGTALQQIRQRTEALTGTANEMSASASRTGIAAETAASAAAQALGNAQTVAAAAEQLTASIREIGLQVGQSHAVISRAVNAGDETRTKIEALNQEVERIGAVADMIGEIASKTNLLALNATIEAARAGDAGKGFAVVASEVKQLAAQTARSTHEIAEHINQVRSATEASVAAVARIEQTITEVSTISGSIAAAVEQQGAATAEIARTVTETASAADEMTARTGEVSNEAHDTDRHAADVRENVAVLAKAIVDLSNAVIRVVRTSTAEVDRRGEQRVHVERDCQLAVGGQTFRTQLVDLSTKGAQLSGTFPLTPGDRGRLVIDGMATAFPCTIKVVDRHAVHLTFALDPESAGVLNQFLERLGQPRAA